VKATLPQPKNKNNVVSKNSVICLSLWC